jgi:hypothetical protein
MATKSECISRRRFTMAALSAGAYLLSSRGLFAESAKTLVGKSIAADMLAIKQTQTRPSPPSSRSMPVSSVSNRSQYWVTKALRFASTVGAALRGLDRHLRSGWWLDMRSMWFSILKENRPSRTSFRAAWRHTTSLGRDSGVLIALGGGEAVFLYRRIESSLESFISIGSDTIHAR